MNAKLMQDPRRLCCLATLAASAVLLSAGAGSASAAAEWRLDSHSNTVAIPGEEFEYHVEATNVGNQATGGPVEILAHLPAGMTATTAVVQIQTFDHFEEAPCTAAGGGAVLGASEVECDNTRVLTPFGSLEYYEVLQLKVDVDPGALGAILTSSFEVSGGGAGSAATVDPTPIAAAPPGFGIESFDSQVRASDGAPFTQAAAHPEDVTTPIDLNTLTHPHFGPRYPAAAPRDIVVDLPPGLVGNPNSLERCSADQLANTAGLIPKPLCPAASQVGTVLLRWNIVLYCCLQDVWGPFPVFNMEPPPGVAARFGFNVSGSVVAADAKLRQDGSYGISVGSRQISQALPLDGVTTTFWGRPASHSHDRFRACPGQESPFEEGPTCPGGKDVAFLRMPTSCGAALPWSMHTDSWLAPGALDSFGAPELSDPSWTSHSLQSHELPGYPATPSDWGNPLGLGGCAKVPVKGELAAKPTSIETETPTGLDVHVEVPNPGLENPEGISSSDLEAVKVALPQGVTINPSQAEGLGVCTPARYESTELSFHPDPSKGCPEDSKIGTVQVKTQLLEETLPGDVFVAQPDDPGTPQHGAENPFDSLLAIYVVLDEPRRGILVKLAGEVKTDERTGQIVTEFRDLPQVPFESFDFSFRQGARAPLVTPPTCGTYTTHTELTPWSNPSTTLASDSSFQIARGIGGAPCPPGGTPGFKPGFSAGSINNNAGSFSPFLMRLTRADGEQDMTKFSSVLPPGVLAKIAGLSRCTDAAIAAAKAPGHTGLAERANPSCPESSKIGRTLVGAGVGSVLAYVPGSLYLGGPYRGAPLSVVSITPAVAGPFDVGTVVVQVALSLDPRTGEVHVDGDKSDPIPHILRGIPLKLRDLRVYVDRPSFTLNPTSCDPSRVGATLFGSAADVFSSADDVPVALSSRYQAANCSTLGFKPRLALKLKGGTRRGGHPALRAVLRPRPGDANLADTVVTLPHSAFLDQAHIRTICTRVQFAAAGGNGAGCPKGAIYGHVKAFTPLLDEPLEGAAFLRSSNHKLPDLVFALHGLVDIEAIGRIDSIRGGIRASFEDVPDAPLAKVIVEMQGAKKGLIVNSRNLCDAPNRAKAALDAQNGKIEDLRPPLKAACGGGPKGARKGGYHRR